MEDQEKWIIIKDNNHVNPLLFDTEDDAFYDMFESVIGTLQMSEKKGSLQELYPNINPHEIREMESLIDYGDDDEMQAYWYSNDHININKEEVIKLSEYEKRKNNPGYHSGSQAK